MTRISTSLRQAVIATADGSCAYCHSPEELMGVTFEVDHIVPRAKGGQTNTTNLCLSCPTCNRHKAHRVKARDPLTRRIVRLFHPNQDKWPEHFAFSEDKSHIVGLTPSGRATAEALRFNRPSMVLLRQYWIATGVRLD